METTFFSLNSTHNEIRERDPKLLEWTVYHLLVTGYIDHLTTLLSVETLLTANKP